MIEKIRCDSAQVIRDVLKKIENKDYVGVKEASDNLIHCASIYQDQDSISLSVSVYALSKMGERHQHIDEKIIALLKDCLVSLDKHDVRKYQSQLRKLLLLISRQDRKLKKYIRKVINDARIRKGFRIYEHGLGMGKTADLLGISQWELMKYVGKVVIPEISRDKIPLHDRIEYAEELFGLR